MTLKAHRGRCAHCGHDHDAARKMAEYRAAAAPTPTQVAEAPKALPQAMVGEASGVAVRSRALADEVLLALESYSDGGTDKEQLAEDWSSGLLPKVYDTLNLFAALTPSPAPSAAPQEVDALREDAERYRWLRSGVVERQGRALGDRIHREINRSRYSAMLAFRAWCEPAELDAAIDAARAALAQHQAPQQGEQHE